MSACSKFDTKHGIVCNFLIVTLNSISDRLLVSNVCDPSLSMLAHFRTGLIADTDIDMIS